MDQIRLAIAFLFFAVVPLLRAQYSCPAPNLPELIRGRNLFTAQQEVWLGDAQAAIVAQTFTLVDDKALTDYLQAAVDDLAHSAPPDHVPFRVRLIDLPTVQAFSIAGGRIYVSTKLVAFTQNKNELAGVLAHEMGHIIAHHAAIENSDRFRKILGVTRVADREDLSAKWNEMLRNYHPQKPGSSYKAFECEEREQLQADTIALYLVSRAGYSVRGLQSFLERLAGTKANTSGLWSKLLGTTKPDSKRLAQIIKNTPTMPTACVASEKVSSEDFESWRRSVIEYSATNAHMQELPPRLISNRVLSALHRLA